MIYMDTIEYDSVIRSQICEEEYGCDDRNYTAWYIGFSIGSQHTIDENRFDLEMTIAHFTDHVYTPDELEKDPTV